MSPDLIIFDCDGVLVDSEPIVNRVFVEMMAELGFELDYEDTLREFSGGLYVHPPSDHAAAAEMVRSTRVRGHLSSPSKRGHATGTSPGGGGCRSPGSA